MAVMHFVYTTQLYVGNFTLQTTLMSFLHTVVMLTVSVHWYVFKVVLVCTLWTVSSFYSGCVFKAVSTLVCCANIAH